MKFLKYAVIFVMNTKYYENFKVYNWIYRLNSIIIISEAIPSSFISILCLYMYQ